MRHLYALGYFDTIYTLGLHSFVCIKQHCITITMSAVPVHEHSKNEFCFLCELESGSIIFNESSIPAQLRTPDVELYAKDPGNMLTDFNNKIETNILEGSRPETTAKCVLHLYKSIQRYIEYKNPQRAQVQTAPTWTLTSINTHIATAPRNANTVAAPLDRVFNDTITLTNKLLPRTDADIMDNGGARTELYFKAVNMTMKLAQTIAVLDRNKQPAKERQARLTLGTRGLPYARPAIKSVD